MTRKKNKPGEDTPVEDEDVGSSEGTPAPEFRSQPQLWDEPSESRSGMAPASFDAPSSFALRSWSTSGPGPIADEAGGSGADPSEGVDTIRPVADDVELIADEDDDVDAGGGGGSFDDGSSGDDPVGAGDGWPRRDPFALVSLVLGVLTYPCCCVCSLNFPVALAAVISGVAALVRIKSHPELWTGRSMALAGIGASVVNVVAYVVWVVLWVVAGGLMGGFGGLFLGAASDGPAISPLFGG